MPDRIIKESICTSDTLNQLTDFEERFWHRLTVNCDDYGRFDARPAILKGRLFPLMDGKTQKNMTDALNKLASVGLIELYEVDGRPFLHVVNWDKHQRIRARRSKFPDPDGNCRQLTSNDVKCRRNPIQSESESESNPNPNASKAARTKHGEFGWVLLSDEEYGKLLADLGEEELQRCIAYIDESAQTSGNKNHWKDWNLVIRRCNRDKWGLKQQKSQGSVRYETAEGCSNHPPDQMAMRAIQRMMEADGCEQV